MQVPPLSQLFIFRIEHRDNLPYILEHGMHIRGHAGINPDHIFIGNAQLTATRHTIPVRPGDIDATLAQQYGDIGNYVPFYFGPCSPMLYAINKGSEGVTQRPQRDIIYLCCRFNSVLASDKRYAFTDGHAKMALTEFYTDPAHLANLHWDTIYSRFWFSTEAEFDRARQKQAEMLVESHVPPEWIEAVVVHNDEVRTFAQAQISRLNHRAAIRVHSPTLKYNNCPFYYP